jgi:hypothetical protein
MNPGDLVRSVFGHVDGSDPIGIIVAHCVLDKKTRGGRGIGRYREEGIVVLFNGVIESNTGFGWKLL